MNADQIRKHKFQNWDAMHEIESRVMKLGGLGLKLSAQGLNEVGNTDKDVIFSPVKSMSPHFHPFLFDIIVHNFIQLYPLPCLTIFHTVKPLP